jgi:hypothetical protein
VCASDMCAMRTCSARSEFLCECSLRRQFDLELARQVLTLELSVLTHVGRDHTLDLLRLQEDTETPL